MKELLVVIDMQKDFVDGALGTKEAVEIVPKVVKKIKEFEENSQDLIFTKDTHTEEYLDTQEGKKLPVEHCIKGSSGWDFVDALQPFAENCLVIEKPGFGSVKLAELVGEKNYEKVTLIGLCTDICVISNALILKGHHPELPIYVDASCCAGVTPASHKNALEAMKICQITIVE
ncbi:cysteine hydrolase family protein [Anaerovorax sp. IOR16]|uniref:cysteine hydrolase family protein n=1 Tax=Anaerovorax sp. IOR16 TaxID=2773458 RepID=UPI0019D1B4D7|nr:isochorismatase family cysteine hydrolase [Anaerovorax sp. IOR16]